MGKRKEEINGKNDLITKRIKKKKESEKQVNEREKKEQN